MGRLKNFEIMLKESAAIDDAAYIRRLERENARLMRENNELEDENAELKSEIQALKNFIQKIIKRAANVYAKDVAESVRLQKTRVNYENDPYLQY